MNADHDFSRSPRRRQRRRETGFYCVLGCAAALAVAAVLALGWFIEGDSARLQAATLLLQTELQQLQPRLAQLKALEATVVKQHEHLELQVVQATQRAFAPQALHALAVISPAHIRLQQIVVRADQAEIRGAASDQQQLQVLVESLNNSGLGQVRLQEIKQEMLQETRQESGRQDRQDRQHPQALPSLRYRFTLTVSRSAGTTAPLQQQPLPPPPPAPPANSEAAPIQRAKRT